MSSDRWLVLSADRRVVLMVIVMMRVRVMIHLVVLLLACLLLDPHDRYPAVATDTPIAHPFSRRFAQHQLVGELAQVTAVPMIHTVAPGSAHDARLVLVDQLPTLGAVGLAAVGHSGADRLLRRH